MTHLRSVTALCAALLLLFATAGSAAAMDLFPTDRCAADKIDAAASLCKRLLKAESKLARDGDAAAYDQRVIKAEDKFEASWAAAEAAAVAAGGTCAEASASVEAVAEGIAEGVEEIAEESEGELNLESKKGRRCAADLIATTANACHGLLDAERKHMKKRAKDALREDLAKARDQAGKVFRKKWKKADRNACEGSPEREDVTEEIEDLVSAAVVAATTTDAVGAVWEEINPDDMVEYLGKDLDPQCWDGSEYTFFARRGTVNKLVMYYMGGGACWSGETCGGVPALGLSPTFNRDIPSLEDLNGLSTGFADQSNPDNPFRDWHAVFVPYCTGDVHWGDAVVDHMSLAGDTTRVAHKGYVNAQVAEKWAREHFVHPDQVFVTGSSAGAYGAIVNSLYLQENAFPSADFAVLGDAGNGVVDQTFLETELAKWGIEDNLPPWIPGLAKPLTELTAADLYVEAAKTYPQNRFATYTTSYDGGNGGQTGFFQVMRTPFIQWRRWWDSSCDWNAEMLALNEDAAANASNFRYYVGAGSRHTMWGADKVYTDTTGNVPTIVDWVNAMLDGTPDWVNVQCDDCDIVLPGDPEPNFDDPLQAPYTPFTEEGEILCPDPGGDT